MSHTVKWGILSAGNISGTFAEALKEAESSELYAVAARDSGDAEAFAGKHGGLRATKAMKPCWPIRRWRRSISARCILFI